MDLQIQGLVSKHDSGAEVGEEFPNGICPLGQADDSCLPVDSFVLNQGIGISESVVLVIMIEDIVTVQGMNDHASE